MMNNFSNYESLLINLLYKIVLLFLIWFFIKIIFKIIQIYLNKLKNNFIVKNPNIREQRKHETILKLFLNIIRYINFFIFLLIFIFIFFGFSYLNQILIGASLLGFVAIFIAQDLLRDIVSGFFIMLEEQFLVGDYIIIGSDEGIVKEIGLRNTKIQLINGLELIASNRNIDKIKNISKINKQTSIEIKINYFLKLKSNFVKEKLKKELTKELDFPIKIYGPFFNENSFSFRVEFSNQEEKYQERSNEIKQKIANILEI